MILPIEDKHVDRIVFSVDLSQSPFVQVDTDLESIAYFFSCIGIHSLHLLAKCVVKRVGFGTEDSGFDYPDDLDLDEEPFEGVRFCYPPGQTVISLKAFERMMLRYFETAQKFAYQELQKLDIQFKNNPGWKMRPDIETQWKELTMYTQQLKKRLTE